MLNGPILVTERLILRPPAPEDFDAFAAMARDAFTMEHIGGVMARSTAWRQFCTLAGAWHINGFSMFSVIERATGHWVGRLGPWQPADWPGTEVGWGVAPEFSGKGYAYEGSVAAIDYAFDVLGWDHVIHCIAPTNHRSQALAKRLGSVNVGPTQMPAPWEDHPVDKWQQSATEWRARRS